MDGKNFLLNVGGCDFLNFDNLIQFSNLSSATDQEEIGNFLPLHKQKEICFSCYKLLVSENSINYFEKFFCGEVCKDAFTKESLVIEIFFI